jgi:TolA-binding protein
MEGENPAAAAGAAAPPAGAEQFDAHRYQQLHLQLQQLQMQMQQLQQLQMQQQLQLQLQLQLLNVRAPQPGNERPPFLVRRPVARKLFSCVSHALLSNEEALCIQYVKTPTNANKFAFLQNSTYMFRPT